MTAVILHVTTFIFRLIGVICRRIPVSPRQVPSWWSGLAGALLIALARGGSANIFKDDAGRTFVNHCGTVKGFNACLVNYPDQDVVAILGNGDPVTPARRAAVAFAQLFLPPP